MFKITNRPIYAPIISYTFEKGCDHRPPVNICKFDASVILDAYFPFNSDMKFTKYFLKSFWSNLTKCVPKSFIKF